MTLQSKFFSYFIAVALIPMIAVGVFSFVETQNRLTTATTEHLSSVANLQKARLTEILDRYIQEVRLVTSKTQLRASLAAYKETAEASDFEKLQKILYDTKDSNSNIYSISLISESRVIVSTDSKLQDTEYQLEEFLQAGAKTH